MNTLIPLKRFQKWLVQLKDRRAYAAILVRLEKAQHGNFGTYRVLSEGVCEMKIDVGAGYRVYYAQQERTVYLLLLGGDKSSQKQDIEKAIKLWRDIQSNGE